MSVYQSAAQFIYIYTCTCTYTYMPYYFNHSFLVRPPRWLGLHPSHIQQLRARNNKSFQSACQSLSHSDTAILTKLLGMGHIQVSSKGG
ncbi:hypothetical protein EON63_09860, partial [archaeon]